MEFQATRPIGENNPVSDEDKAKMLELYEDGHSVRSVARIMGRSTSTVSRHLHRMGADTDRSLTAEATAARVRKLQEKRLDIAEKLMDDVESMRDRTWSRYELVTPGPDGASVTVLDEPPLRDQSDGVRAIQSMVTTIDTLLEGTGTDNSGEAKNVLMNIFEGLAKVITDGTGVDERDRDHDYDIAEDPDEQAVAFGTPDKEED